MRVLIADDHDLVRDTIAAFLGQSEEVETATATSLPQVLEKVGADGPFDLVLLDWDMPGMGGLDGLRQTIDANGEKTVAILSGTAPRKVAQDAVEAGAIGFLPKTMGATSLMNAVRFMAMGEVFIPAALMAEEPEGPEHPLAKTLSARELQVLEGLCRGESNKEIARTLDLQEVTIKLHVKTLCRKLEAKNRTQAAMIAKEAGLF
ncbi:response regulator transcription factor [Pontivivens ytuae]|uniref:Response regulator transcription factor n=1 Tax=Pontivivens ytuae TaxID=2789856 RepID=A0A7S9LU04_9RHOB|nr:response regulator transcription factor [Pontivivens ytuae]QPH55276.1 response regulator transcription factor [Pontivivens ytuae]